MAGSIDTASGPLSNTKLQLINTTSGEDLGTYDLSGNDPNTHIYASEAEMFSDTELDRAISGQLNNSSKETNQQVVLYRDGTKIKFRTVFNDLGTVEIRIKNADGSQLATISKLLTADADFGDFLEFMSQRIQSIDVGALPAVPLIGDAQGDGSEDDYYYEGPILPLPLRAASFSANHSLAAPQERAPWSGRVRNLLTKCSDTVVVAGEFVIKPTVGIVKGVIDGFWDGAKSDAKGIAELALLATGDFKGDFHRAKQLFDGLKLLKNVSAQRAKDMLNATVDNFMSESARNLPWEYKGGNLADSFALVAYSDGYLIGYVSEQVAAMYLGAGVISKVGQGMKVALAATKAGQIAANVIDKSRKLIVPLTRYLTQFASDTQVVRVIRAAVQEAGLRVSQGGKYTAEIIQECIERFEPAIVNAKTIAEEMGFLIKVSSVQVVDLVVSGTIGQFEKLTRYTPMSWL